jgi:sodium transport system permease protein
MSKAGHANNARLRLDWPQVRTLYARELRAALRERTILVNSILIPVCLYPFLLWCVFTAMMFVMGQTEGIKAQVMLKAWPGGHPGLRKALQFDPRFEFLPMSGTVTQAEAHLREGRLDAFLEFVPATGPAAALPGNFEARITCNRTRDLSVTAREQLGSVIEKYRSGWLEREARKRGINAEEWQGFTLDSQNVASSRQLGAFILGLLAPVIFVVMVAVGCFYPAVDALAGERERQTWETLISTSANRLSIVTAKYLYVVTLGGFAGLLNLLAVMLTAKPVFAPLLEKAGKAIEFTLAPGVIPIAILAAVLLAGFVAAGMMVFAAFARTFKEGQAMITPFYMLILLPVVMLQAPGAKLSVSMALVPVANVTLMVREAVSGNFPLLPIGITVVVSLLLIALFLRLAAFVLQFEDVVLGSYNGSLFKLLREKLLKRRAAPLHTPESIA